MKLLSITPHALVEKKSNNIPITARGRALYTTDYFLNGTPILKHHDNPAIKLENLRKVN